MLNPTIDTCLCQITCSTPCRIAADPDPDQAREYSQTSGTVGWNDDLAERDAALAMRPFYYAELAPTLPAAGHE